MILVAPAPPREECTQWHAQKAVGGLSGCC